MAVADMARLALRQDRLRRAVARADDQVVLVEVELLDRHREQRQVVPVEPA